MMHKLRMLWRLVVFACAVVVIAMTMLLWSATGSAGYTRFFDPERAEAVGREFGAEPHVDHREVLSRVEAAVVSVPTSLHFDIVCECLEAGLHVLVEKPLTAQGDEAADLVRRARDRDPILQVGHNERFNPGLTAPAGELGTPRFIEARRVAPFNPRGTDVDVVLDLMIHDIDIVLSIVKAPLAECRAWGLCSLTPFIDMASATLEFTDGTTAGFIASRIAPFPHREMNFYWPDHQLYMDLSAGRVTRVARSGPGMAAVPEDPRRTVIEFGRGDSLAEEVESFLVRVGGGEALAVTGGEGLRALEVAALVIERIARVEACAAAAAL